MGGLLSGLLGGGESNGQQQQMQALKASREDIQRLRPELMQAKLNLLRNATGAYQGSNNALETLWGDPNAKPTVGGPSEGGPPQRMFGHDLPSRAGGAIGEAFPGQGQPKHSPLMQGISTVMDPLNIFKGR